MFESKFFILGSIGFGVTVNGEKYEVTTPSYPYYQKMIGKVIEEESGYTQLVLHQSGVVMVTKVSKENTLLQSTQEYLPFKENLPVLYENELEKLKEAFENFFKVQLNLRKSKMTRTATGS